MHLLAEGLLPGVSDLFLPWPSGAYAGAFIEMKAGNNKLSDKQEQFLLSMRDHGYAAVVVWGWIAAADFITSYMQLADNQSLDPKYNNLCKPKLK
jgi:hypothetical protein